MNSFQSKGIFPIATFSGIKRSKMFSWNIMNDVGYEWLSCYLAGPGSSLPIKQ